LTPARRRREERAPFCRSGPRPAHRPPPRARRGARPVAAANAINLTDLRWNPAESGRGATVVQQDDTAIVTLCVHGADGEPTWLIGVARSYAIGRGGPDHCRGPLYRAPGSWYGAPSDPGASDTGTFEVTGLEFTDHGFSGDLRTTRADRIEYGRFGGARY